MKFAASLAELDKMIGYVKANAEKLEKKDWLKLELALEEALVNVIQYAYPPDVSGSLDISIREEGSRFYVEICDEGEPFNPLDHEPPKSLNAPLTDRQIGGLGIHFVRQLVPEICYQRKGNVNSLTLVFDEVAQSCGK